MKTHHQILTEGGLDNYSNYAGDVVPDNFQLVMSRHRDSDLLTNCNWECALKQLGGESDSLRIERIGHWAVGWLELMFVDSNNAELHAEAQELHDSLEDYPVLDDEAFSRAEEEEAQRVWTECYSTKERIAYIRKHRDQFIFDSWHEIRVVAQGEFFNGYASELIQ